MRKVALEVVTPYDRVFIDDYESFVVGPSKTPDLAFVPLYVREGMSYIDHLYAVNGLSTCTEDLYSRLRGFGARVESYFSVISGYGYN